MRSARASVLAILLLALVPSLLALRSRAFFSPDETYYAEVAREMLESGDAVVPLFDGRPFLEKPPLIYWLLAGAFAVAGWSLAAAVMLNTGLTAATALLLFAHLRRSGMPRAGLLASLAYLTMLLPSATARTALTDPALTLCTTASLVLFFRGKRWDVWLSGLALGLGVLAKGPVAPLFVVPALATLVAVRRDRTTLRRAVETVAVAVVVAAPWHVLLAGRGFGNEYLQLFLGRQVMSRAIDTWPQGGPWWYYLPVLWAASFPWGTHLLLAVRQWWGDRRREGSERGVALAEGAAVIVPILAFSLAANKFPHYVLPALPWLAAWLGRAGDRLLDPAEAGSSAGRIAPLAGLLAGGALTTMALVLLHSDFADLVPRPTAAVLLAAAIVWVGLGLFERRRPLLVWASVAGLSLLLHAGADAWVIPNLDRRQIERPLAEQVRRHLPPDGVPVAYGWFRPSFVTYGARGWRIADQVDDLATLLEDAALARRPVVLLARSDMEGPARAGPWRRGGEARELVRVRGLGEMDGEILEASVFAAEPSRDGRRWFYDADTVPAGIEGFSGLENNRWTPSFRWCVATTSTLTIPAAPGGAAVLRLRVWGPDLDGRPQKLTLALADHLLGEIVLAPTPRVFALPVPAEALRADGQRLQVFASHAVVWRTVDPASHDDRPLVYALDWIALDPAAGTIALTPPADAGVPSPAAPG